MRWWWSRSPACRKPRRAGSRSTAGIINSPTSSRTRTARWQVSSGAISGWILVHQPELSRLGIYERYAKDILRDRFYVALERHHGLIWINLLQMPLFFAAGFFVGWLSGETPQAAGQTGLSIMMFGVFVRTVLIWHITWAVNSVTHLWGYRSYETGEDSRNNILVGLISNGEGWHNNHHADPRSARHGHRWWEIDNTWLTIRALEWLGLASDVVTPRAHRRP